MGRKGLIVSWSIIGLLILITLGIYINNFFKLGVSDNPERWAQFGDYISGVLNPFIAIINLIVLTYITIALKDSDDKRNEFTLQELARPLGHIVCCDYEDEIAVKLKNSGLGPLIIANMNISDTNNGKTLSANNLISFMPKLPSSLVWSNFVIDCHSLIVAKDSEIDLIKIRSSETELQDFNQYKRKLREKLASLTISIEYTDIYDRKMGKCAHRNLKLFARTL